jgi:AcrR family transcriptional regulator
MVRHKEAERNAIMKDTRQSLLAAAADEFARFGFDGANVNRIAKSAGFSIGTVYNYFSSKRQLLLAFVEEIGKLHVEYIAERVKQEEDPRRRIEVFYQAGFAFVESHVTQAQAIFNTLNGPDEEFKQHLWQTYQPLFLLLGNDILGPGISQGLFRPVDPVATASLLMLIYLGTGSQFSPQGKLWLAPEHVAVFVLNALLNENQPS